MNCNLVLKFFIMYIKVVATLTLGSQLRQGACKVTSQEGSLGVTSRVPGSAKECEGVNLHTPK
jgi:hypothetical protein